MLEWDIKGLKEDIIRWKEAITNIERLLKEDNNNNGLKSQNQSVRTT